MVRGSHQETADSARARTAWLTRYALPIGAGVLALGMGITLIAWKSQPSTQATGNGQRIDNAATGGPPAAPGDEVNTPLRRRREGKDANARIPAAPGDEVNTLLRLLSQNIRIGLVEIGRPIDPLWLKDIRQLQSSSNPVVAKTARAVEASAKKREEAFKLLEATEAKNDQLRQEMPNIGDAVVGSLGSVSDSDIDAARASGSITAAEAEAYQMRNAANERVLLEFGSLALRIAINNGLANRTVRSMRKKAETLEADAVAEHLVPALRARAGAKRGDPPLRIAAGMGGSQQDNICVVPSIVSTANEPLTRLTLLMEIRVPPGRRRAVAFIPKLEPGRGVQISPVPYDFSVVPPPTDRKPIDMAKVIRYSVWCDQFTYEGEEVPITPSLDARVAYCSLLAEPGRSYDLAERRFGGDRTTYRLEFTELTPDENSFRVKGNVRLFDSRNPDKPLKVTPFHGTFRSVDPVQPPAQKPRQGSPPRDGTRKTSPIVDRVFRGMPPEKAGKAPSPPPGERKRPVLPSSRSVDALLTIADGSEESEIDLFIDEDGSIRWLPQTGLLRNRMVRTTEQIIKIRAAVSIMAEARDLAMAGKKDEAVKVLKDFIATKPGEQQVARAEQLLKQLDWLAAQGAQMKQFIDARRNDPRPPSAMGDFGKGPGGFGGLQPPGGIGGRGMPGPAGKEQSGGKDRFPDPPSRKLK